MRSVLGLWNRYQRRRIRNLVLPYTLVSTERINSLYRLAQRIEEERVPGDVIECGVCNGGTAAVLARFASRSPMNRKVWLFDSFQGMPGVTNEDGINVSGETPESHVGKEIGDLIRVTEVLRKVRTNMDRVRVVPGWFQDTFPSFKAREIALLNIDADWYESVKLCLHTFYDRVVPGGFVSFDDYGHWPGCKRAVDEFFEVRQLPYKLIQVDYSAFWFQKK
jgi:O-methyltransferase